MIQASGISVKRGDTTIVHDVDLTIAAGDVLGIVGPNGCGKTTLLRSLYGSLPTEAGTVTLNGTPLGELDRKTVARTIAVVVQEQVSDIPVTVAELVAMGRMPHNSFGGKLSEDDELLVAKTLDQVGLLDRAQANFASLSGGERQRALIARSLTQQSEYLLLDEPTNHLDIHYQHEVLKLVSAMENGSAAVLHDLNLAARYCTRIAVMNKGRVLAEGTPEEVLTPEILEPVYHVKVRRLEDELGVHLIFVAQD